MEYVVVALILFFIYLYDRFSKKTPKTSVPDGFNGFDDFEDLSSENSYTMSCSGVSITIHR